MRGTVPHFQDILGVAQVESGDTVTGKRQCSNALIVAFFFSMPLSELSSQDATSVEVSFEIVSCRHCGPKINCLSHIVREAEEVQRPGLH